MPLMDHRSVQVSYSNESAHSALIALARLAAILEFAVSEQQKTAIQEDSGVRRVLLVAGARNRRYLHLDYAIV